MGKSQGNNAGTFAVKRIYEDPSDDDGCRVLVDRLWPRGVSMERAHLELWLKDVAPSPPLRKEFAHMQERFAQFRAAYEAELETNPAVQTLYALAAEHGKVTLLFGARDPETNHARVLQEFLERGSNSRK
ncbi:Uncharacterized conserved protein YeaO, DUF488 family [Arthrobacter sp. 49Tsu3.1M3]|uniref:DUF488 domain-containing protein n=1 Tax=Arthrobacter sp. 49Tsu3.1M3 TaxID=1279029 RepID=UPI0009A5CBFE|nr:DUF488 family protein [Arthrobacter sp. 49Tsu3.1M3]SKB95053.1 Uncharacterized conserved protein YeaO, DUF488 family [Arthrobacter sp. 49Tsu3.1M3]